MNHRVAQVLLLIAGIGFLIVPMLVHGAEGHSPGSHPARDVAVRIGLAALCFCGAIVAGRNAGKQRV